MPRDANLILDAGETVIANGDTTAIDTEGGFLAWVFAIMGAMSGADTTCDIYVQASPDGGSNYYMIGKFQQLGPTNDDAEMRIPVYIPRPSTGQTVTKVRLHKVVAGVAPSYVVEKVFVEPMLSIAPPAIDENLRTGAVCLLAAT